MKRKSYNRISNSQVYINIAPLVEVMLVIVVMFMLTPQNQNNIGIKVNLPETHAPSLDEQNSDKQPVIISIDKDCKISLADTIMTIEELISKLPNVLKNSKCNVIYVRGDKNLAYGKIMEIMGIISSSGAYKVSLMAEQNSNTINENNK